MENTTRTSKSRRNPLKLLVDFLDALVSARADEAARRRGHTVTRIAGTRVHVYRDPRWDRRREVMPDADREPELVERGGET